MMPNTKIFYAFLTLLFLGNMWNSNAQDLENREQIKSLKVSFLTTELQLSPEEAQKFWPLYHQYDDQRFDLHKRRSALMKQFRELAVKEMDDREAEKLLTQMERLDDEYYENRKKMLAALRPIMNSKRILQLKKAEDDFNRKLLRQYKNKSQ